jgi:hypothetical protein
MRRAPTGTVARMMEKTETAIISLILFCSLRVTVAEGIGPSAPGGAWRAITSWTKDRIASNMVTTV